jgi:CP family cyanate transporter-like MFS transporter
MADAVPAGQRSRALPAERSPALSEPPPAAALGALLGGAVALRPQVLAIGPLTVSIQAGLGLSHGVAGLLSTIPVLCMGLFAPSAQVVADRVGTSRAVTVALAGIAALGCLRAVAPGAVGVLLLTLPLGIAIAIGNALMPIAAAQTSRLRPLLATGAYTTGMTAGSIVATLVAVPLANALGGWRAALGAFGVLAALSLLGWTLFGADVGADAPAHRVRRTALPWGSALAWRLVLAFCAISIFFYGAGAWLPAAYVERGWSEGAAAVLMVVWNIGAIIGGIGISLMGDRVGSRRGSLLVATTVMMVTMTLLIVAPSAGLAWAVVAGIGNGVVFTVLMTLPLDIGRSPGEVAAFSGMMLGVGYSVGALGPFAMGVLRDATGSFTASLWILVVVAGALAAVATTLGPAQLRRGAERP